MTPEDLDLAIKRVTSGETITQVARDLGVPYSSIYSRLVRLGIAGGLRLGDRRSPLEKIRASIEITTSGHWLWVGRRAVSQFGDPALKSRRNCARYLAGLPTVDGGSARAMCGIPQCINPEHEKLSSERNQEILDRWKRSEECKKFVVTMQQLGYEYGLTKQRIEQIIRAGATDRG